MPVTDRSIRVTDAYRRRLLALQRRAALLSRWDVTVRDVDGTGQAWVARATVALEAIQAAGVTLTSGYLTAYIASETARVAQPVAVRSETVGQAQDGQPLAKSLAAALITVKAALKDDREPATALRMGENRASRLIQSAALSAPRSALHASIDDDPRLGGWRRVTFGGCGACLAAADGKIQAPGARLKVHDHCRCVAEPVVTGTRELAWRPTGRQIFDGMTPAQQNRLLGDEKAGLIRTGQVPFERLIQPQPMAIAPDGITERPLAALT